MEKDAYLKPKNREKLVEEFANVTCEHIIENQIDTWDIALDGIKGAREMTNRELLDWYIECNSDRRLSNFLNAQTMIKEGNSET